MSAPRTIGIGILGFGTVGQGVWKHLSEKQADLETRLGVKLDLRKACVRDLKKKRAVKIPASKLTKNPNEIIDDPKVHVVCELIGGTTKARELTLRALRAGKVVVSANKALLCEHGPEIFAAVRQHGGQFLFEASVAGGIPIIKAIREGLVANRFELIVGILNGTCNHILTRMGEDGLSFADALKEAQELGYAEADPTLDVDGIDAWHKASILAWLAHGKWAPRKRTPRVPRPSRVPPRPRPRRPDESTRPCLTPHLPPPPQTSRPRNLPFQESQLTTGCTTHLRTQQRSL